MSGGIITVDNKDNKGNPRHYKSDGRFAKKYAGQAEVYDKEEKTYKNHDNFIERKISTPYFEEHISDKLIKRVKEKLGIPVERIETVDNKVMDKLGVDAEMYIKGDDETPFYLDLKVMTGYLGQGEKVPDSYGFIIRKQDDYSGENLVNATVNKENLIEDKNVIKSKENVKKAIEERKAKNELKNCSLTDLYVISYYRSYLPKKEFTSSFREDDILGSYTMMINKQSVIMTIAKKLGCKLEEVHNRIQDDTDKMVEIARKIKNGEDYSNENNFKIEMDRNNKLKRIKSGIFELVYNKRGQTLIKANLDFASLRASGPDVVEIDEMDNKKLYQSLGLSEKEIRRYTNEERVKKELGLNEDQN